jgi:lambda repressor-like predicted transcriptional regulator
MMHGKTSKMKTESYSSKSQMMKEEKKTPMKEKMPKGKVGIAIMIGVPKQKAMPMRGSRTATNMMKKSSRGK